MNLNKSLEKIYQKCRICLKEGEVNIWNCKVSFQPDTIIKENFSTEVFEKSFIEIMDIFFNSQDLLNFTDEFPLLCCHCLEDLKYCYIIYEKIKLANIQLEKLYQQSLNKCIEEEHLIEVSEANENNEITENEFEILEEDIITLPEYESSNTYEPYISNKSGHCKEITPGKNDAYIVTQFIPETLQATETYISNHSKDNDLVKTPRHFLTVNLKAVEVKDLEQLDSLESSQSLRGDITESAIYLCQYCPRAFSKSDYLKTHIQKSHVCKFCTLSFSITEDLFRHIREVHTENKCPICHKLFSSRTNLRHHIKRLHRIKLPAKVTLIDFIKANPLEGNTTENEENITQKFEATGINLNTQYVQTYDSCIDIFGENSTE